MSSGKQQQQQQQMRGSRTMPQLHYTRQDIQEQYLCSSNVAQSKEARARSSDTKRGAILRTNCQADSEGEQVDEEELGLEGDESGSGGERGKRGRQTHRSGRKRQRRSHSASIFSACFTIPNISSMLNSQVVSSGQNQSQRRSILAHLGLGGQQTNSAHAQKQAQQQQRPISASKTAENLGQIASQDEPSDDLHRAKFNSKRLLTEQNQLFSGSGARKHVSFGHSSQGSKLISSPTLAPNQQQQQHQAANHPSQSQVGRSENVITRNYQAHLPSQGSQQEQQVAAAVVGQISEPAASQTNNKAQPKQSANISPIYLVSQVPGQMAPNRGSAVHQPVQNVYHNHPVIMQPQQQQRAMHNFSIQNSSPASSLGSRSVQSRSDCPQYQAHACPNQSVPTIYKRLPAVPMRTQATQTDITAYHLMATPTLSSSSSQAAGPASRAAPSHSGDTPSPTLSAGRTPADLSASELASATKSARSGHQVVSLPSRVANLELVDSKLAHAQATTGAQKTVGNSIEGRQKQMECKVDLQVLIPAAVNVPIDDGSDEWSAPDDEEQEDDDDELQTVDAAAGGQSGSNPGASTSRPQSTRSSSSSSVSLVGHDQALLASALGNDTAAAVPAAPAELGAQAEAKESPAVVSEPSGDASIMIRSGGQRHRQHQCSQSVAPPSALDIKLKNDNNPMTCDSETTGELAQSSEPMREQARASDIEPPGQFKDLSSWRRLESMRSLSSDISELDSFQAPGQAPRQPVQEIGKEGETFVVDSGQPTSIDRAQAEQVVSYETVSEDRAPSPPSLSEASSQTDPSMASRIIEISHSLGRISARSMHEGQSTGVRPHLEDRNGAKRCSPAECSRKSFEKPRMTRDQTSKSGPVTQTTASEAQNQEQCGSKDDQMAPVQLKAGEKQEQAAGVVSLTDERPLSAAMVLNQSHTNRLSGSKDKTGGEIILADNANGPAGQIQPQAGDSGAHRCVSKALGDPVCSAPVGKQRRDDFLALDERALMEASEPDLAGPAAAAAAAAVEEADGALVSHVAGNRSSTSTLSTRHHSYCSNEDFALSPISSAARDQLAKFEFRQEELGSYRKGSAGGGEIIVGQQHESSINIHSSIGAATLVCRQESHELIDIGGENFPDTWPPNWRGDVGDEHEPAQSVATEIGRKVALKQASIASPSALAASAATQEHEHELVQADTIGRHPTGSPNGSDKGTSSGTIRPDCESSGGKGTAFMTADGHKSGPIASTEEQQQQPTVLLAGEGSSEGDDDVQQAASRLSIQVLSEATVWLGQAERDGASEVAGSRSASSACSSSLSQSSIQDKDDLGAMATTNSLDVSACGPRLARQQLRKSSASPPTTVSELDQDEEISTPSFVDSYRNKFVQVCRLADLLTEQLVDECLASGGQHDGGSSGFVAQIGDTGGGQMGEQLAPIATCSRVQSTDLNCSPTTSSLSSSSKASSSLASSAATTTSASGRSYICCHPKSAGPKREEAPTSERPRLPVKPAHLRALSRAQDGPDSSELSAGRGEASAAAIAVTATSVAAAAALHTSYQPAQNLRQLERSGHQQSIGLPEEHAAARTLLAQNEQEVGEAPAGSKHGHWSADEESNVEQAHSSRNDSVAASATENEPLDSLSAAQGAQMGGQAHRRLQSESSLDGPALISRSCSVCSANSVIARRPSICSTNEAETGGDESVGQLGSLERACDGAQLGPTPSAMEETREAALTASSVSPKSGLSFELTDSSAAATMATTTTTASTPSESRRATLGSAAAGLFVAHDSSSPTLSVHSEIGEPLSQQFEGQEQEEQLQQQQQQQRQQPQQQLLEPRHSDEGQAFGAVRQVSQELSTVSEVSEEVSNELAHLSRIQPREGIQDEQVASHKSAVLNRMQRADSSTDQDLARTEFTFRSQGSVAEGARLESPSGSCAEQHFQRGEQRRRSSASSATSSNRPHGMRSPVDCPFVHDILPLSPSPPGTRSPPLGQAISLRQRLSHDDTMEAIEDDVEGEEQAMQAEQSSGQVESLAIAPPAAFSGLSGNSAEPPTSGRLSQETDLPSPILERSQGEPEEDGEDEESSISVSQHGVLVSQEVTNSAKQIRQTSPSPPKSKENLRPSPTGDASLESVDTEQRHQHGSFEKSISTDSATNAILEHLSLHHSEFPLDEPSPTLEQSRSIDPQLRRESWRQGSGSSRQAALESGEISGQPSFEGSAGGASTGTMKRKPKETSKFKKIGCEGGEEDGEITQRRGPPLSQLKSNTAPNQDTNLSHQESYHIPSQKSASLATDNSICSSCSCNENSFDATTAGSQETLRPAKGKSVGDSSGNTAGGQAKQEDRGSSWMSQEEGTVFTENYWLSHWLYISEHEESEIWRRAIDMAPLAPPDSEPSTSSEERRDSDLVAGMPKDMIETGSTISERSFSSKYKSTTRKMIHRRATIEMYKRIMSNSLKCEKRVEISRSNGEFGFRIHGSRPVVVSAIERGTSAETCGLQVGDLIYAINGTNILDMAHSDVVKLAHSADSAALVLDLVPTNDFLRMSKYNRMSNKRYEPTVTGFLMRLSPSTAQPLLVDLQEKMAQLPGASSQQRATRLNEVMRRAWRRRYFVLRSDNCLYWYRAATDIEPYGGINLQGFSASLTNEFNEPVYVVRLVKYGGQPHYLGTNNICDIQTWIDAINKAATEANQNDPYMKRTLTLARIKPTQIPEPDCSGYLYKFSHKRSGGAHWRAAFFVLKDACLYLFKDQQSELVNQASAVYYLHGYKVRNKHIEHKKHTFELIPPNRRTIRTIFLMANSETDKKRWIAALEYSIDRWIEID